MSRLFIWMQQYITNDPKSPKTIVNGLKSGYTSFLTFLLSEKENQEKNIGVTNLKQILNTAVAGSRSFKIVM